jgi:hypothetical protein
MIKAALASFAAFVLVAGAAGHADAANQKQKRYASHYGKHSSPKATYGYRSPATSNGSSDYYEHVLDKVPFGSKRWWSIYEEQHGSPDG